MKEPVQTHCLFCSLGCPISLGSSLYESSTIIYNGKQGKATSSGLCGRGSSNVELIQHPDRLKGVWKKTNGELPPVDVKSLRGEFETFISQARAKGRIAAIVDGNLPCEDIATIAQWVDREENTSLSVYLPPTDWEILDALHVFQGGPVEASLIEQCDGIILVGNVFSTHPVLARRILDKKFENPRNLFASIDTRRSVSDRFGNPSLVVSMAGQAEMLQLLRQSLNAQISPQPDAVVERIAEKGRAILPNAERLVGQLQKCRKLLVVVSAEPTMSDDWYAVTKAACDLAGAKNGGVLALPRYGNAMGAYRIARALDLPPMETILDESSSSELGGAILIGCDPWEIFAESLPGFALRDTTRVAMFAQMHSPLSRKADLLVGMPMPAEYQGTSIDCFGEELSLQPTFAPASGTVSPGVFFRHLNRAPSESQPALWRQPVQPRERAGSTSASIESEGDYWFLGTLTPIHFEDGLLTRQVSWTDYWQGEPEIAVSEVTVRRLGVRESESIAISRNGARLNARCKIDSNLDADQVAVPLHFSEARKLVPWSRDSRSGELRCSPFRVSLNAVAESKDE